MMTLRLESQSCACQKIVVDREHVALGEIVEVMPGETVEVMMEVRLSPVTQVERFTARTTTGEAKLHVHGEVCPAAVASPASLLVEEHRARAIERVVQLRSRTSDPLTIETAKTSVHGVTCRIDHELNQVAVRVESEASFTSGDAVEIEARVGTNREMLRVPLVAF